MHNANFSPPLFHIVRCPLCHEIFRIHSEFMNHVQTIHPLSEQDAILNSHVDAYGILLQNASSQRNDRIVVQPTMPPNRNLPRRWGRAPLINRQQITSNQLRRWGRAPPINRQQMAIRNRVLQRRRGTTPPTDRQQMARSIEVRGSNSTFADSNESNNFTKPLINQLDVPISSNADDLVNIAEEQNDLDLTLRL
ncbi:hypothetical protein FXO38_05662 [Capsicum annuum]|nr:hypothetical protein FXO37_08626 [Capsicum annuum]KAF3673339.1 hypothetical protein FXO38_05662 [Capsicum annuum]